ncbi:MAG: response regulator [Oligoflexia bacterium]|nr:response regulator [Oligoflexia bacterium]MBF0366446.1 response regulator [Oligoflexia bacterium]
MSEIKILIIDDEEDFCQHLSESIGKEINGITIAYCVNGTKALEKIKSQKFDLMICDLKMPGLDGKEILQLVSKLPKEQHPTYILMLSGLLAHVPSYSALKKVSYMGKPFTPKQMFDFVKRVKQTILQNGQSDVGFSHIEDKLLQEVEKYLREIF